MALPMIEVPKYHTLLPSTGEKVIFRPFLVKEQKQLLVAVGGDAEQQMQATEEIISACTFEKIDARKIPAYDAEYLFLQIRARSIGENIDLILTCNSCEETQPAKLDLTIVGVKKPEGHEYDIDLGKGLILTLADPNLRTMDILQQSTGPDAVIELIARCISKIWNNDELFDAAEYSLAELIEFIENLSPANLAQLEKFFETLPVLRHEMDFECKKCGAKNTAAMESLQGFFV
jgi:hypothetical protein